MGLAQAQLTVPLPDTAQSAVNPTVARVRTLPAGQFARLIEMADVVSGISPEDEFLAGLEIILAGLARQPTPSSKKHTQKPTP